MKQLTLVMEDRVGLLADITYLLGKSKINIESIAVNVIGGKAIIHLTVDNEPAALKVLVANHYECLQSDLLLIQLANTPGALSEITRLLAEGGVNIENTTTITQDKTHSLYALKVNQPSKAIKLLSPFLATEKDGQN